jgi:hypothetical protein
VPAASTPSARTRSAVNGDSIPAGCAEAIRELYLTELSARGLKTPSPEALDADVAAIAGDPLPRFRLAGQAVTDIVKLLRNTRHYP